MDSLNKSRLAAWFRSTPQYGGHTVLYDYDTAFMEIWPRYEGFTFRFLGEPKSEDFRLSWDQIYRHCRAAYIS